MRMLIFSIARLVKYVQSNWNFARITIRPNFYLELDRILYDSVHNSVSFIQCQNSLFPVTAVVIDNTSIHTRLSINKRPIGLIAHLSNTIQLNSVDTITLYKKTIHKKAYVSVLLNTYAGKLCALSLSLSCNTIHVYSFTFVIRGHGINERLIIMLYTSLL